MKQFSFQPLWNWWASGIALGVCFLLAVLLVKPIGVSTQFVILDGLIWNAIDSEMVVADGEAKHGFSSPNAYLNKGGGKYAKHIANPWNYGFIFALAMIAGGLIAKVLTSAPAAPTSTLPQVWRNRFGDSYFLRFLGAFIGGFFVLFGARLAGGCTSGHMMSGMMQTSLSGYLFALGAFVVAVPTAILIFRKETPR